MNITDELFNLQDTAYRDFALKLLPPDTKLIGVRLPKLRKIAKDIVKNEQLRSQFIHSLNEPPKPFNNTPIYFEELLLKGFIIAYLPYEFPLKEPLIRYFVSKINNWSICDSFCASFHLTKSNKAMYLPLIKSYLSSDKPYELRFALVMLLDYYLTQDYADNSLKLILPVKHSDRTVKMAKAWAISKYFACYPEKGFIFLQQNKIKFDSETWKMTLQKIRDSLRVSSRHKKRLKTL